MTSVFSSPRQRVLLLAGAANFHYIIPSQFCQWENCTKILTMRILKFVHFYLLHFLTQCVILISEREVRDMEIVSYILSWEDASICAVYGIEHGFPCFTKIRDIDEDSYEVTIHARVEDLPAIMRRLAPYV